MKVTFQHGFRLLVLASLPWLAAGWGPPRGGADVLPGSAPLEVEGDLSLQMMEGIGRLLDRKIGESQQQRSRRWHPDKSSPAAYTASLEAKRRRLGTILGVVDQRLAPGLEFYGSAEDRLVAAESTDFRIYRVRWPVLEGVWGEGLLLRPRASPSVHIVLLPDADQTPEQAAGLQGGAPGPPPAQTLARSGCQVFIPTLISRGHHLSGNPRLGLTSTLPHREWLYRQAFEMGRHIIGYEVQKILSLVDWVRQKHGPDAPIGVAGYGEGGLLALHAAALDTRIEAALVSGYFGPRGRLWEEPVDRNVWAYLKEFGDAELAGLIAPRPLIVEHSRGPELEVANQGNRSPTPGRLRTPSLQEVESELARARLLSHPFSSSLSLVGGQGAALEAFGSEAALRSLLSSLGIQDFRPAAGDARLSLAPGSLPEDRLKRQFEQIQHHVQELLTYSEYVRDEFVLEKLSGKSPQEIEKAAGPLRDYLWEEVLGRIDEPLLPLRPRTRKIYDRPSWTGYEVILDVWPESFAWGILLVPKGIQPGEKRPVVVCQHGGGGVPRDVIEGDKPAYHDFAARLAEQGFITYAPHNPHNGRHRFGPLQRKANSIGLTLWSVILAFHEQQLNWLESLPFVDPERIAFYGLSYGGKTAMRIPALLNRYCLSICSADFNDWIYKTASVEWPGAYLFSPEYDQPTFNLGHTFNYAEMAYLIFPRPFMVERGFEDRVAPDRWVAGEYAKVRKFYQKAGLADRTEIEWFDGGHTIHGEGTFRFLRRHLGLK